MRKYSFVGRKVIEGDADAFPKGIDGSVGHFPQRGFNRILHGIRDGDGVPQVHLAKSTNHLSRILINQMGPFVRGALLAGVCRGARTGECLE